VSLDATAGTIRGLVLGKGREEASGGPTFLVRLRGEFRPDCLDAGQSQFIEQQLDARGIDGGRYTAYAASPWFERADTMPTEANSS
jgi:hypothetical protein